MAAEGIFFLVAGPTAAGKTVLLKRLLAEAQGLEEEISVTTRAPRPGEVDGRDRRFWTRAAFEQAVGRGEFLEHAVVHGAECYGTLRAPVLDHLARGVDVIKDIDVQGVAQVRRLLPYPRSVALFVLPPSPAVLLARFRQRGTEDPGELAARLASARKELERTGEFEYLVCNDDLARAVADVHAIRRAEHLRRERCEADVRRRWAAGTEAW